MLFYSMPREVISVSFLTRKGLDLVLGELNRNVSVDFLHNGKRHGENLAASANISFAKNCPF